MTKSILIFCSLFVVGDILTAVLFFPPVGPTVRPAHLYYHHGLRESATQTEVWGGRTVEITTNSLGLRDTTQRTVPTKSNKHRILFLGDSMIEGQGVPAEVTFPEVFATIAANAGHRVEVLNGGNASNSGTLYYYHLLYLAEVRGVQFDEVYVFLDPSDPQDDIFYRHYIPGDYCFLISRRIESFLSRYSAVFRSFFTHSARNSIEVALRPTCFVLDSISPNPLLPFVPQYETAELKKLMSSLDGRFSSVRGLMPWEANTWPKGFLDERFRWVYDDEMESRWAHDGVELTRLYLDKLASYLRSKNIPLALVIYPNPYHLRGGKPKSYVDFWSTFAAEHKIAFISFFDNGVFDGRNPEKTIKEFFIDQDVHWNEAGHYAVAKELFADWCGRHAMRDSTPKMSK